MNFSLCSSCCRKFGKETLIMGGAANLFLLADLIFQKHRFAGRKKNDNCSIGVLTEMVVGVQGIVCCYSFVIVLLPPTSLKCLS